MLQKSAATGVASPRSSPRHLRGLSASRPRRGRDLRGLSTSRRRRNRPGLSTARPLDLYGLSASRRFPGSPRTVRVAAPRPPRTVRVAAGAAAPSCRRYLVRRGVRSGLPDSGRAVSKVRPPSARAGVGLLPALAWLKDRRPIASPHPAYADASVAGREPRGAFEVHFLLCAAWRAPHASAIFLANFERRPGTAQVGRVGGRAAARPAVARRGGVPREPLRGRRAFGVLSSGRGGQERRTKDVPRPRAGVAVGRRRRGQGRVGRGGQGGEGVGKRGFERTLVPRLRPSTPARVHARGSFGRRTMVAVNWTA